MFGMGLLANPAKAQKVVIEDDEPNTVMLVSRDKAGDEVVRILKETENQRFHDPKAPRFLLTDSKGRFALGIGGYVKAVAEYDFDGISRNVDFYPSQIPDKGASRVRNQFQMDVTTSTIFLKLVGHTKNLGDFVVYTAGNFRGGDKVFQLQNAYAQFLGFTLGYDYSIFMDLSALPPTIDFAGPCGQIFYRSTQFRYERKFAKYSKFGVGIEMPVVSGTVNDQYQIGVQRMPNFPAYVQLGWNSGSHVRLAGLVRSMTYDDLVADKAASEIGWGAMLATTFNVGKKWQLYGQGVYGRGIGGYLNDISNLNADLVPDPAQRGHMQSLPMMGWYAGVQYNICPKVFASTTYSQTRLYSDNGYPAVATNQYRYGQYFVANIFWNVTSDLQMGAEYLHGWRKDFDSQERQANRINLSAQYSF